MMLCVITYNVQVQPFKKIIITKFYKMEKCEHRNIVLVEERPIGKDSPMTRSENSKFYVKCEDCGFILPVDRVTIEIKEVPLTNL